MRLKRRFLPVGQARLLRNGGMEKEQKYRSSKRWDDFSRNFFEGGSMRVIEREVGVGRGRSA